MKIVNRQEVTITIDAGEYSGTAALSGFTTLAKMVPIGVSWSVEDNTSPVLCSTTEIDVEITSTALLTISRAGNPATEIIATVYVVEFGSDTTVQSGTFGIASGAISNSQAINSVTLAQSFVVFYRKSTEDTTPTYDSRPSPRLVAGYFSNQTQLTFERYESTYGGTINGHWYVVSSNTLSVIHGLRTVQTGSGDTFDETISSIDTTKTFLISSYKIDAPVYNGVSVFRSYIVDATTLRFYRYLTSQDNYAEFRYQVITSSDISVQRGTKLSAQSPSSGYFTFTESITSIALIRAICKTSEGRSGHTTNQEYTAHTLTSRFYMIHFSAANELTFTTCRTAYGTNTSWEVIEFSEEEIGIDISSAAQAQSATGNTTILSITSLSLDGQAVSAIGNASILSVVSLSSEIQAQSAVGNANIDSGINTLSSDAQAQSASGDATVLCFVTMASEAQAHAAIGAAFISAFISVSSSVQAQRAAASANMLIDGTVSLASNVQAQSSIAGGSLTMDILISGNVQAPPAIGSGFVGVIVSISGNVEAQPATGTGGVSPIPVLYQSLAIAIGIMV